MNQQTLTGKLCALATIVASLFPVWSSAQESKGAPREVPLVAVDRSAERASGVIIKVEPIYNRAATTQPAAKGRKPAAAQADAVRLTINTAAVWRDWARDQVSADSDRSTRAAAERGANSVATKGEPETKDSLVVVRLESGGAVETRFRTLLDESTKGAKTPTAARDEAAGEPAKPDSRTNDRSKGSKTQVARPIQFHASDLRPGLFVEVDYRGLKEGNQAKTVTVIRPISESAPEAKPAAK